MLFQSLEREGGDLYLDEVFNVAQIMSGRNFLKQK
jgi:hypothetical protein